MALRFRQSFAMLAALSLPTQFWGAAWGKESQSAEYRGSIYPSDAVQSDVVDPFRVANQADAPADRARAGSDEGDQGENVRDAVFAALVTNPRVELARSQIDAAKADRFAALGQFLPDVEVSASYTDQSLRSSSLQTLQDRDGTTLGITAIQPITQGLTALNRYRGARAKKTEADFSYDAVRQETAQEAARAHASVLLAREIVAHRVSNLSLLNRQYEVVRKRQEAGAQGRTGVEQARVRRAQAQVDLGAARSQLAQAESAYRRIVGHQAPPEFSSANDLVEIPESLLEAVENAELANPSINAAASAVEAARFTKRAAAGDFAPKVTLEGSYLQRFGADSTLAQQDEEYQVVARMRMPLFKQGRNVASLRNANASVREAQALLDQTRLSIHEAVTRSWRQLEQAELKRIAAEQGIEAAKQSVKGLQLEYEAGQRSVIDVLDGQRDLVLAEINLSQAEFDLRVSRYDLAASTGAILFAFGFSED